MAPLEIDTEFLIKIVGENPVLWDLRCPGYKFREEKQLAWKAVASKVYENFDEMSKDRKASALKSIHQRWKSARDQYLKTKSAEKNSNPDSKYKRKYIFADSIKFLDAVTGHQTTLKVKKESIASSDAADSSEETFHYQPDTEEILNPAYRRKKENENLTQFETQILKMLKTNNDMFFDEDITFFNSLLPTIRRFTPEQKFYFKGQVMQLAASIAYPNIDMQGHHMLTPDFGDNLTTIPTTSGTFVDVPTEESPWSERSNESDIE
ncbi:hypothetical protein JTB14_028528 [Gonioctena quinquepunctata]|nr:hypothetical protein JTB14_028528 [Gonioctena quinquepunctata]